MAKGFYNNFSLPFQMDGTLFNRDVIGTIISYNEVLCPLESLYSIDEGSGPMPFYRYNVTLSNDGTIFSTPITPDASVGAVVYDSECIDCQPSGECSQIVSLSITSLKYIDVLIHFDFEFHLITGWYMSYIRKVLLDI